VLQEFEKMTDMVEYKEELRGHNQEAIIILLARVAMVQQAPAWINL
jgi:hypothetical protein